MESSGGRKYVRGSLKKRRNGSTSPNRQKEKESLFRRQKKKKKKKEAWIVEEYKRVKKVDMIDCMRERERENKSNRVRTIDAFSLDIFCLYMY